MGAKRVSRGQTDLILQLIIDKHALLTQLLGAIIHPRLAECIHTRSW